MKKYLVIYCAPASAAEAMQSATAPDGDLPWILRSP